MKTLKFKLVAFLMLTSIAGIACEHCDDEDIRRKEQENAITMHSDTLKVND